MLQIMLCLLTIILAVAAGGKQEKPVQTSGPAKLSDGWMPGGR